MGVFFEGDINIFIQIWKEDNYCFNFVYWSSYKSKDIVYIYLCVMLFLQIICVLYYFSGVVDFIFVFCDFSFWFFFNYS